MIWKDARKMSTELENDLAYCFKLELLKEFDPDITEEEAIILMNQFPDRTAVDLSVISKLMRLAIKE